MARYRKIDPRIWNDAKFSSLSNDAKLLFIYLLTSPQTQMIGAVPMRAESVAAELGFDMKRYGIGYQELYKSGIAEYDDRGLYWVKNFLKYNSPDNPKVVISWRDSLDFLPECPLLKKVIESAKSHCVSRGEGYIEAFKRGIGNSMTYGMQYGTPYKEQEHEQDISTNVDKKEKYKKEKKSSKSKIVLDKPEDVSSNQIWIDFLALRNARHAPLTETALNIIRKEAEKAGITLDQALETCCMRGWQGFKAEWYLKGQNASRYQPHQPRDLEPEFRPEDYEGGLISDLMQR